MVVEIALSMSSSIGLITITLKQKLFIHPELGITISKDRNRVNRTALEHIFKFEVGVK